MPTHEQTVALDFGERASIVLAEAPASPSMAEDPGLWVGVGVAVLAIAGALAVGFAVAEPSAPDGGSTDVVLLSDSAPRVRFGP